MYTPYLKLRHVKQYHALKAQGYEDDDLEQECCVEALRYHRTHDIARGMSLQSYILTYAIPAALTRLLRKKRSPLMFPLTHERRDTSDPLPLEDALEHLSPGEREAVEKFLSGAKLDRHERKLYRNAEARLKEVYGVS